MIARTQAGCWGPQAGASCGVAGEWRAGGQRGEVAGERRADDEARMVTGSGKPAAIEARRR
jgi:hypothetical protein